MSSGERKDHESPEAIGVFLAGTMNFFPRILLENSGAMPGLGLKFLRSLCRAATHGRMPRELRRRYEAVLRGARPHVLALRREGVAVPDVVLSELDRVRHEIKRRRRGATGAAPGYEANPVDETAGASRGGSSSRRLIEWDDEPE